MDGSMVERSRAEETIAQSRVRSRNTRVRTRSYEWFGHGDGLGRLRHYTELGSWDAGADFYSHVAPLCRVRCRVTSIVGPEKGTVEVAACGIPAFFVPSKARKDGALGIARGRDENLQVFAYLGFSYEGLRAWSVDNRG